MSRVRTLVGLVVVLTITIGHLTAQSYTFSRAFQVTAPPMYGDDVRLLQQRLFDLGYVEVGEIDGYYGPMTHAAVDRFRYRNGLQLDEGFHYIQAEDLMRNNVVRGDPLDGPRPHVIAFGRDVIGGWLPGEGWVEKWTLFEWFNLGDTIQVRDLSIDGERSVLPVTATVNGEGRHWGAPYAHLQAPRLEAQAGGSFDRDRWYVEVGLRPTVVAWRQPSASMQDQMQAYLDDWKREHDVTVETLELKLYEMDVNQDGLLDYVVDASNGHTGAPVRQGAAHFTLFQLWLGTQNGDFEIVDFHSHAFGGTIEKGMYLSDSAQRFVDFVGLFDFNADGMPEFAYYWRVWTDDGTELIQIRSSDDVSTLIGRGPSMFVQNR